jgi:hypothetical protein
MADDRIVEFLTSNEFDTTVVRDILASKDREQSFSRAHTWRQINQARKDNFVCIQELRRQRVFIPDDIRRQFSSALEICTGAQAQRQVDHAMPHAGRSGMFIDKFLADGDAIVDGLATAVNKRLFRGEAIS